MVGVGEGGIALLYGVYHWDEIHHTNDASDNGVARLLGSGMHS